MEVVDRRGKSTRAPGSAETGDRLDHLVDLGVTHVEILPVNAVPGRWNWGYDGVNWYATSSAYGGPQAFQAFVDACHAKGLAVCLDVVYNHLGPNGNYLPVFMPIYNEARQSPWGTAINLDGPNSDEVRRFIMGRAMARTDRTVEALRALGKPFHSHSGHSVALSHLLMVDFTLGD